VLAALRGTLGLCVDGIAKALPALTKPNILTALGRLWKAGKVRHYMSDDAPPVDVYYVV
jgi:hypothetical protein